MTILPVPLTIRSTAHADRTSQCEPVTMGVPLPRGMVRDPSALALTDECGRQVPLQALVTERWVDGSVRWALLDFQVVGTTQVQRTYHLHINDRIRQTNRQRLTLTENALGIVVDTGMAQFRIEAGTAFPFAQVTSGGSAPVEAAPSALLVTSATGKCRPVRIANLFVEQRGELRSTVRFEGTIGARRRPALQVIGRIQFFAGSAAVRMAITLRNLQRARHRGGHWELGDRGSIYLRDVTVRLAFPSAPEAIECSPEATAPIERVDTPLEIYQDSSGGESWEHATHVNRRGEMPLRFRGYRLAAGSMRREGLRATPAVVVRHGSGCVGVAMEHFWQNFPKALEVDTRRLDVRLFPAQFGDLHELQGGEQKTHRFTLMFGDDALSRDAWFWARTPSSVAAAPAWYSAAEAVPYLFSDEDSTDARYESLVAAAIEGAESLDRKREQVDEYGWRHFGDLYADHENAFSGEPTPIVSHYNNQYDAVAGFACQFMRSGDERWRRLMDDLATHVADIDIYHTDRDKAAYNHGLFWHTAHYVAAGRSSHRSYPRSVRVAGGGPANEHNYATGLRLHWLLTGDPGSREAAIGLAGWVIHMDDGRKTILRWLSAGDTGLASQTQSTSFHGPGRGAGNSVLALLDGHRLRGEPRFLAKAEQLIRRCIHPHDDPARLNLLDAERRWSYTVFLQALGKYLDYKVSIGQIDRQYAYGREALLQYARWMLDHEYPYLEKPDILEYPTETWAAQDMRKCEVFLFAAMHAAGAERDRFIERARFFFDYSVSTLVRSETRALTRPLVLLLSNGFMCRPAGRIPTHPAPPVVPATEFGAPVSFVPQKAMASRRLATAAAVLVVVALTATIACLAVV